MSVHDNRPDIPLTIQDVLDVVRDHYEGTDFDLTKGLASGNYVIVVGLVSLGGVAHLCDALWPCHLALGLCTPRTCYICEKQLPMPCRASDG